MQALGPEATIEGYAFRREPRARKTNSRMACTWYSRRPGAVTRMASVWASRLIDGVGGVGAVGGHGPLHAGPPAVPGLHLAVPRPHEQHEALLGVGGVED